jgi:hypothetical protein
MRRNLFLGVMGLLCLGVAGCGSSKCVVTGITVSPASGTANHTAGAPGNQQAFNAFLNNGGCVAPGGGTLARLTDVVWSSSDPTAVSVSNTAGATYGVATCLSAASSVTITATEASRNFTGIATLACQ